MRQLSVYVETSVWSYAIATDVPDFRESTLLFFASCKSGFVRPFISPVVLSEIQRAQPAIRDQLMNLIREVAPDLVEESKESIALADAFVREHAIPPSKPEDARHVGVAFAEELDVLVSWNFRHIASVRRSERFNAIAVLEGFLKPLRIAAPLEMLHDDESEPR